MGERWNDRRQLEKKRRLGRLDGWRENAGQGGTERSTAENTSRKARRMPYTIRIYKPRETFRMHIRLERWPTVDFRRGRELTFALPLCANSHKDSLFSALLVSPLFILPALYHSPFFLTAPLLSTPYENVVIFFQTSIRTKKFSCIVASSLNLFIIR